MSQAKRLGFLFTFTMGWGGAMNRKTHFWLLGLVTLGLLAVTGWIVVEGSIEATSHAGFCGSCHVMQPMVLSYFADSHGGQNRWGVRAECTDCHTPHESPWGHLWAKTRIGVHDILVTIFTDESRIDWQARREARREYVYDSGCLSCHENVERFPQASHSHAKYFAGLIDARCVDCHETVGHKNLSRYLQEYQFQAKP